jgi:D-threo-aldose 1-dehydrogenase
MALHGTSLSASRFGLGTHSLHRLISGAARSRLLALAYELGLRYFDTAPCYGAGLAERELGRFAQGRRSELVLTTKFGIPAGRLAATVPGWTYATMAARVLARSVGAHRSTRPAVRNYRPDSARASLEHSLRALRTDCVDILYLHEPSLQLLGDVEALSRTLETLKAEGKVRYIGLSGSGAECAQIAHAHPSIAQVLQIEVHRDGQGLPVAAASQQPAAVSFWEFAAGGGKRSSAEHIALLASRLSTAAPAGVLMLSTHLETELRDTVGGIERIDSLGLNSETATLA